MKKILFISATSNTNLKLADNLCNIFKNISSCSTEILNIEKYKLPLFNPSTLEIDKADNLKDIITITDKMISSDAFIICAPEYNGNVPPVLSNAIAWISVSTNYWKDGFKNKYFLIGSSSGGNPSASDCVVTAVINNQGNPIYVGGNNWTLTDIHSQGESPYVLGEWRDAEWITLVKGDTPATGISTMPWVDIDQNASNVPWGLTVTVPLPVEEQVVSIYAGTRGYLDTIAVDAVTEYEQRMLEDIRANGEDILEEIRTEKKLTEKLESKLNKFLESFTKGFSSANTQKAA